MNRRILLALPLLAAVPAGLRAAPRWRHDVSEIRYGGSDPATPERAGVLQARLGVAVRAVVLPPAALAEALNRGALECASLTPAARTPAAALMGDRLILLSDAGLRRALPSALRDDLGAALLAL